MKRSLKRRSEHLGPVEDVVLDASALFEQLVDESATYDASAFPNPDEQSEVTDSRCQLPDPKGDFQGG